MRLYHAGFKAENSQFLNLPDQARRRGISSVNAISLIDPLTDRFNTADTWPAMLSAVIKNVKHSAAQLSPTSKIRIIKYEHSRQYSRYYR